MAKIKFERTTAPIASVEFSRNPSPQDYSRKTVYLQPKDRSDGGDPYIYDKALNPEKYRTLHWRNIPSADLSNFMTFLSIVAGGKYDFIFTDYDGSKYFARIWNAEDIQSAPVMTGRESLTIEILVGFTTFLETLTSIVQSVSAVEDAKIFTETLSTTISSLTTASEIRNFFETLSTTISSLTTA
ncbi:MAG: hypothetical protein Q8M92_02815, partial [Candidatus Subteraquimicrobiales bacterium]|nr:hypothetical protein [Candidatus Subteraquimicrobiales bacterium]